MKLIEILETSAKETIICEGVDELLIIKEGLKYEEILSSKFLETNVESIDSRGCNIIVRIEESIE
ncbi:MAG: hypothetical protein PHD56_07825 [Anaerostipes sp.]|nr:hypothetical protein [Anaerostipes sp.]